MPLFFSEPTALGAGSKIGVLLLNIGAPKNLSLLAVRQFLYRFLGDPRVIEVNPVFWKLLLKFIILPRYGKTSLAKYQKIWPQNDSEPRFLSLTRTFAADLQQALDSEEQEVVVRFAMNYSAPYVQETIMELKGLGIDRLLILPLFPQYSATTTAAGLDQVWTSLTKIRLMPAVTSITSFYDNPLYITALSNHIKKFWQLNGRGQKLLFSFHGIPQKYVDQGDPYYRHCRATTEAVAKQLALKPADYLMGFQSKFGGGKWLGPATNKLLTTLPQQNITNLDIVAPSFLIDCLETLEELDIIGKDQFTAAGGKTLNYIPCLNNDPAWVQALASIITASCPQVKSK